MAEISSGKRNRNRGKRNEKALAKILGGKRVGLFGGQDVEHDTYSFELKERVSFAGNGFMKQCERNCPADKIPVVIVHVHQTSHNRDLVMMRLSDWVKIADVEEE